MIYRNKRDSEAWVRERTVESLKENDYLIEGDIVLVAETNCFYKIVSSKTPIELKKNLFAQAMTSELIVEKLKTARIIKLTGDVTGEVSFDGTKNVEIKSNVVDDSHTHSNTSIKNLDAGKIVSGILAVERIPNLDAAKVASGILNIGRIPNLDANKINSGVMNIDRIPALDAKKVASGVLAVERIPNLDASKITSGIINIDRIPAAALERLVEVDDDTARFKLTKEQIQLGDVVKVTKTLKMYKVINDDKLNSEAGYSVFVAGRAAEVPWSGVSGKPKDYPATPHNHTKEQITNFPASMKNPFGLIIKLNGNGQGAYDGSSAKEINITPASIGAQVAGNYAIREHKHTASEVGAFTKDEVNNLLNGKANSSHGNHVPSIQSADNRVYLRNDNTWHTITPGDIGAQPAGRYANESHNHDTVYSKTDHSHSPSAIGAYTKDEVNKLLNEKANNHTHPYLATNGGTISGDLTVTGTIVCNNDITAFSDKDLKTNIKPLNSKYTIDKFMNIDFYSFNYKENINKLHYGVIAQELQEIYPEMVVETEKEINGRKALSVNYQELFIQVCSIVQEQERRIKMLEQLLNNRV